MQERKRPKIKEESDEEEAEEFQHEESSGQDVGPTLQKNENGEAFCELGKNKRVTVREFKGKVLIDVREVRQNPKAFCCSSRVLVSFLSHPCSTFFLVSYSIPFHYSVLRKGRQATARKKRYVKLFLEK